ncbi:cysteine synthase A [Candidatus Sororendozoicomonas aggregata]|uniref:cysteine synthase A n=1 Tax=Candidatus Sororendozoicomonas aggregata TaxID=3073239 RepID=UPI002ED6303C
MLVPYDDNSLSIGNTPLVKLNRLAPGHRIFMKMESRNPLNCVKCRIGASMIWDAEASGQLKPGISLLEATSGNTGIALAFVAASRGVPLTLTMPASMSLERRKILKAFGATLVLTEAAKGMNGAVAKAEAIAADNPGKYLILRQFENPANPRIHEQTTGPEIWNGLEGDIDVFVAGVGTGGTITGVSRYLKNIRKKAVVSIAVEPEASPVITQTMAGKEVKPAPHKIQGIGAGFVPENLDLSLLDQVERVSNEEAIATAHRLMKEEGVLSGISGGAAVAAALRVAEQPRYKGKTIVVVVPDSGERYLSSALFEGVFSENETVQ